MKKEFEVDNGSAVFLSPKCYDIFDNDDENNKRALKGIQSDSTLTHQHYIDALYNNKQHPRTQCRFQFDKKISQMK